MTTITWKYGEKQNKNPTLSLLGPPTNRVALRFESNFDCNCGFTGEVVARSADDDLVERVLRDGTGREGDVRVARRHHLEVQLQVSAVAIGQHEKLGVAITGRRLHLARWTCVPFYFIYLLRWNMRETDAAFVFSFQQRRGHFFFATLGDLRISLFPFTTWPATPLSRSNESYN